MVRAAHMAKRAAGALSWPELIRAIKFAADAGAFHVRLKQLELNGTMLARLRSQGCKVVPTRDNHFIVRRDV